jgi:hypothetical protein
MLSCSLIVSSKIRSSSSSITMLCNMMHAINTFAITFQSHNRQGFARSTTLLVSHQSATLNIFTSCLLQLGKMFALFSLWFMDHGCETRSLKVDSIN